MSNESEIDTDSLPVGHQIGDYTIVETLGRGGFGITYKAQHKIVKSFVAIKEFYPPALATRRSTLDVAPRTKFQSEEYTIGLESYKAEAITMTNFEPHPNLVRFINYIEENGTGYIIMNYIDGIELTDEISRTRGALAADRLQYLLLALADGLEYVHGEEFLHRDIKPSNILIDKDGVPVLIDFGAARQSVGSRSRPLTAILTPGYAPNEQYSSADIQGPYTDLYALGAVGYCAVEGKPPPEASLRMGNNDPYQPLAPTAKTPLEKTVYAAIDWALRPFPEDRPQTVGEFCDALENGAPELEVRHTVYNRPAEPTHPQAVEPKREIRRRSIPPAPVPSPGKSAGTTGSDGPSWKLPALLVGVAALLIGGTLTAMLVPSSGAPAPRTAERTERAPPSNLEVSRSVNITPNTWTTISTDGEFSLESDQPFRLRLKGRQSAVYLIQPGDGLPMSLSATAVEVRALHINGNSSVKVTELN